MFVECLPLNSMILGHILSAKISLSYNNSICLMWDSSCKDINKVFDDWCVQETWLMCSTLGVC